MLSYIKVLDSVGVHSKTSRGEVSSTDNSLAVSNFIEANVPSTGTVFLEHIGLIGYRSGCYIYDSMGLVTPETIRLKRKYGSEWLPKAAREYHADIVILYDSDLPIIQSQTDDDAIWFEKSYTHVKDYQLESILASIYFRRDGTLIRKQDVNQ